MDTPQSTSSTHVEQTADALATANALGWLLGYVAAGDEGRELLADARAAALGSSALTTNSALLLSSAIEGALLGTRVPA